VVEIGNLAVEGTIGRVRRRAATRDLWISLAAGHVELAGEADRGAHRVRNGLIWTATLIVLLLAWIRVYVGTEARLGGPLA